MKANRPAVTSRAGAGHWTTSTTSLPALAGYNNLPTNAGVLGLAHEIAELSTAELYDDADVLKHLPDVLYELALPRLLLVLRELDTRAAAGTTTGRAA